METKWKLIFKLHDLYVNNLMNIRYEKKNKTAVSMYHDYKMNISQKILNYTVYYIFRNKNQ